MTGANHLAEQDQLLRCRQRSLWRSTLPVKDIAQLFKVYIIHYNCREAGFIVDEAWVMPYWDGLQCSGDGGNLPDNIHAFGLTQLPPAFFNRPAFDEFCDKHALTSELDTSGLNIEYAMDFDTAISEILEMS
ncbi:hypothetical protein PAAG_12241 [Paracoccidioides lutzii Pb01]|uniref:Uncharacterized protein n=1 Tax=Paracoccidioides lutzii (strain ATCC MYA-826 / Pb01) TaxID=502779 RepID=A0A0A2V0L8_PARBA|nr:hypothetical protein PAAG_12241 [Paracoccidioides lutzii Pb01]KGQ01048.1 hypothetical protein PAAG_12241 [Paracoccidioides lutzii Pb01]